MDPVEAQSHKPAVLLMDENNNATLGENSSDLVRDE
jgi:hypothetical protein